MLPNEMRQMVLNQSVREIVSMSTRVETKKTNMQAKKDGIPLMQNNRLAPTVRNDKNFMKINRKRSDRWDPEKSIPVPATDAGVSDAVGVMPTHEDTTLIFSTEAWSSAPVIAKSTDVGEG